MENPSVIRSLLWAPALPVRTLWLLVSSNYLREVVVTLNFAVWILRRRGS
ncbi:hypothetical protein [Corynebacterium macginleyi]|nr:hypothetical protein [Corynebacterium macginleyi]MBK4150614.1 hypothetical protein [Corynebacterium macginleyi]MBK4160928.1 hypothetical protein [Corynebacterium macginleyi]MBK4183314.1 hypothetical protein [Corynebacterium macginleyi]